MNRLGLHFSLRCFFAMHFVISSLYGASTLSGLVRDTSGAFVPDAVVEATNAETSAVYRATTSEVGLYVIPNIPPGRYVLTVIKDGFDTTIKHDVVLHIEDVVTEDFTLQVGSVTETVTVEAGANLLQAQSATVDTLVNREFVENMPLNGRSFHSLLQLTPGLVTTPASFESRGQFSVNGQRTNANYFMVDGVSANIGDSGSLDALQTGGSVPGFTAFGGTNNMASVDAVEEFKIQTSTYAAEFGRQPGAQISIRTRSGTNDFHGTAYWYFRNDVLDANDWFANRAGSPRPTLRQNNFGGVFGGPIIKDRTFFFVSYEGNELRQPRFERVAVPTVAIRSQAPPSVQPLLNAFPIPNGDEIGNNAALFDGGATQPAALDVLSIRADHLAGSVNFFGRFVYSDSEITSRRAGFPYIEEPQASNARYVTGGATWTISPSVINEFRGNFTFTEDSIRDRVGAIGGNTLPQDSELFPAGRTGDDNIFVVLILNPRMLWLQGLLSENTQRQVNIVDNLSVVRGKHEMKFGFDYRWRSPEFNPRAIAHQNFFSNIDQMLTETALIQRIIASEAGLRLRFNNLSLFAQDTWRVNSRFTLNYGLRWELNPPPTESTGREPFTIQGLNDPATMTLAPQGTPLWDTTYNNFAPRFGAAFQLTPSLVLRGGFGIFYDLGTQRSADGLGSNKWPWGRVKQRNGGAYPVDDDFAQPLPVSFDPPVFEIAVPNPELELPYSAQWNMALETLLGSNQTFSVSYLGTLGRRLLREELLLLPNPDFEIVRVTSNRSSSNYQALQMQFQRRMTRGLQILGSYAWSHSIDDVSNDATSSVSIDKIDLRNERGNSSFDVRHNFSAAVSYEIPSPQLGPAGRALLSDWAVDTIVRARSAFPLTPFTAAAATGTGLTDAFRPDLVEGQPIYLDDPTAPGGRRINAAAFSPVTGRHGTLGRNAIRGFGHHQIDFSLRRRISIYEDLALQFRVDFFNIFNHPSFATPISNLNSGLFGESTRMLATQLGPGGSQGGFSSIYNIGGPRSIQFAFRLTF